MCMRLLVLLTYSCTHSKDDMEGSGGFFSSGLPGVRGPEGRQVSVHVKERVLDDYQFVKSCLLVSGSCMVFHSCAHETMMCVPL